jgi:uncharacterized protein
MLAATGDVARPLVVPATIVAEVCYMISRYRFGSAAEAAFLRSFASGDLVVGNLVEDDFERMAQFVEQYADFPLGGSDASVIAMAERRSITTILTIDRRHFAAVRPKHVEAFQLLPWASPARSPDLTRRRCFAPRLMPRGSTTSYGSLGRRLN